ncbi:hypothetical protein CDAR_115801 [Caerostris darwini]|uniref:Uncharacterized protein n=1 Tax=Caerostris darwini TaxID=1538125 RepID=A0AAV4PMR0_9ARAC|nr:hypothetical protein CDAR_115801 [Caerostris darwini]
MRYSSNVINFTQRLTWEFLFGRQVCVATISSKKRKNVIMGCKKRKKGWEEGRWDEECADHHPFGPGAPSTDGCGELSWSGSERNRFHLFTRKCSDLFYISLIRRFRTSGEMYERDTVERKINLLSVTIFLMWVGKKCTGTEIRKRNPLRRYSFS